MTKVWWLAKTSPPLLFSVGLFLVVLLCFTLRLCFFSLSSLSLFFVRSQLLCCSSLCGSSFSSGFLSVFGFPVLCPLFVYSPFSFASVCSGGVVEPETRLAGARALAGNFSLFLSHLLLQSSPGFFYVLPWVTPPVFFLWFVFSAP
jgi:hypothetical protein